MALIHTQSRPFYYPPHAPFLIQSRNHQPQYSKPPVPLPASLSPPPSSSITLKMAQAPPFNPQYFSFPSPEEKESARLPPLLTAVAPTAMAHASFYHHYFSCAQPPPMPQASAALLPGMLEFQRSAVPDPGHQTYYFYQPPSTYPLAPAFSAASPSIRVPPPPAPLYYVPPAASPFSTDRTPARKVLDIAQHREEYGEIKPVKGVISTAGGARRWDVARAGMKASAVFLPTRQSWLQRRCTRSWVPKEEAERRRQLGALNVRRSPAGASTSSASSSESPCDQSTFFSGASTAADSPAPPLSLEIDESLAEPDARTTLMMKNIPNKYRREMLMKLLDDHCMEVNKKMEPDSPDGPPSSEYDFVYLPMDFRTNSCLGYAFVNFTTPAAAWRFYQALNSFKWEMFGTKKISHICYARIQGKEAMLANFGASLFRCDSDEYLPVTFSPPRSGAAPCPPPTLVGKRCPRSTISPRQQQPAAAATAAAPPDDDDA